MSINSKSFESVIKEYLDNYASKDKQFAKKYSNKSKSIDECCKYIYQEVRNSMNGNGMCVACSDEEVYGIAVHYYDEEDIVVKDDNISVEKVEYVSKDIEKSKKQRGRKKKEVEVDENIPESLVIPIF